MAIRTTIHLEDDLYTKLKQFTPARGMNRFVNEAVWEKIHRLEQQKIESLMKTGYIATKADRVELNADWQTVDTEEWHLTRRLQ
jgi:metal-responsive CopG/Arc/MetJ family transcriptional regulator